LLLWNERYISKMLRAVTGF